MDNANQTQPIIRTTKVPMRAATSLVGKNKLSLAVIGLFLLFLFIGLGRVFFKPAMLTVIGEGKANFKPTEISMIVTRTNGGSNAVSAINEGEAGIKVLISTAKAIGGESIEIEKIFYQVQPGVSSGQRYQVANGFSLKFNDVLKASEMIKNLYQDGATTVTGIGFSSDVKEVVEQTARKEAVKDAKEKAKRIAKSAGKRLGRVVTISDDNKGIESSIINEGENNSISVTKNISIVYEIW